MLFSTNVFEKFAYPLGEPLRNSLIISTAFQAAAAVVSITGNLIVLIVYHDAKPNLRSRVSSLFTINLAISDLLIGLIILPLMILTNVFVLCDLVLFLRAVLESILIPFLSSVSIWTVFDASVDRFIAIRRPHKYASMVTRKRVHLALRFTWIYSSTWIFFPFLPGSIGKYMLAFRAFIGFLAIVVIIACWVGVYLKLRERRRVLITSRNSADQEAKPSSSQVWYWYCMERKVAKMFFCVTLTLYACFLPLWMRAVGHSFKALDDKVFEVFAITLTLLNSAVNPLIYSLTSRSFRSELLGGK